MFRTNYARNLPFWPKLPQNFKDSQYTIIYKIQLSSNFFSESDDLMKLINSKEPGVGDINSIKSLIPKFLTLNSIDTL